MSVVSFALAIVFIIRLFSTSAFRVPKYIFSMLISTVVSNGSKFLFVLEAWGTIQQIFEFR